MSMYIVAVLDQLPWKKWPSMNCMIKGVEYRGAEANYKTEVHFFKDHFLENADTKSKLLIS